MPIEISIRTMSLIAKYLHEWLLPLANLSRVFLAKSPVNSRTISVFHDLVCTFQVCLEDSLKRQLELTKVLIKKIVSLGLYSIAFSFFL